MKKILIIISVLIILAFVGVMYFAGSIVRAGVEKGAQYVLQVDTKVGGGRLNILSGNVGLSGMSIGNPPGFKSDRAMFLDDIDISVSVGSLTSDTIVIDHITINKPEITIDTDIVRTNLGALMDNVKKSTGGGEKKPDDSGAAQKKLKVGKVKILGAKVRVSESVLGGLGTSITLPDIEMNEVGTGANKDETDFPTLVKSIIEELVKSIVKNGAGLPGSLGDLIKNESGNILKDAGGAVKKTADDVIKGVGGIFK
ncbi:MAG: AsmA family protein [Planctomycetota bacterium]